MSKISCVRIIHFCAGHRLLNHEGKCANLHGHNYHAHITAEAEHLDAIGRVIDFSVLKERVGGWIEHYWDHNFLVNEADVEVRKAIEMLGQTKKPYVCSFNPTAEMMAKYLLEVICPRVLGDTGIVVTKVVLYETDNCYAVAKMD
jgi:6-pyruvoyltetrahydropterin/6-carboxytetrahydropterin synthase